MSDAPSTLPDPQPPSLQDRATLTAIVTALYEGILGRAPDADGLVHHVNTLASGLPIAAVTRAFVQSAEFAARRRAEAPPDAYPRVDLDPPMQVQTQSADLEWLWAHIAATWSRLGGQDPYWSVLSAPKYRMTQMSDAAVLAEFYETGRTDVSRLDAWLARNQLVLRPDMVCAEYGCGVGRVSLWLAQRVNRMRAFDISPTHIERARSWLAGQHVANVTFCQVREPADLDKLAGTDLFYSQIVLQHNPPPIMALILGQGFRNLAPGGIAFFQLPTYRRGYRFDEAEYLAGLGGTGHIEMHCLPQRVVFELAARHGLEPLEVQQDGLTGGVGTSHSFLFHKL